MTHHHHGGLRQQSRYFASMEDRLRAQLDRRRREGTLRSLIPLPSPTTTCEATSIDDGGTSSLRPQPVTMIDFASNDYLGLARCPRQHALVQSAYSGLSCTSSLGATGSRLLSGDSDLARLLEANLAKVHNRPASLLFNSGYDANLSVLSSLPYRHDGDDAIVMDNLVHNSLIMGVRMGRLANDRVFLFRHNDVADLKRVLDEVLATSSSPSILVVVESVYSMDGDVAPLKEIFNLCQEKGAGVMVDEAHGLGVYGHTNVQDLSLDATTCIVGVEESIRSVQTAPAMADSNKIAAAYDNNNGGTGVLAALNLERHPALFCSVHTFGKAAGCHGAVVAGSETLISYLVNYARPFVYSTALPPHSLVSIQQTYKSMMGPEGESRRRIVFQLVKLFRAEMAKGLVVLNEQFPGLEFDMLPSPSPIQAVIVPGNERCIQVCRYLRDVGGLDVYPIRSPTVPKGMERIRIILHSHNTENEVHQLTKMLLQSLRRSLLLPDCIGLASKL